MTFTTTQSGASADYLRYVWEGSITKTDRYKDSVLLDFSLANVDNAFVKLKRGSYITIQTSTVYSDEPWFTGYITNEPDLSYVGVKSGHQPAWGYKYHATSDDYILSLKPIGIMPTFMNVSLGSILKAIATKLCPGLFDYTNVDDGPLVAQYTVDPQKKFSDIQRDFCEIASFTFRAKEHKLYFKPQDDKTITLDGNNKHFTPGRLDIKPASAPVINDVTVLGNIEPQAYVTEYFVGTGLDANFPLIASVFGADSSVLIDEQFGSAQVDSSIWNLEDPIGDLQVSNGYMNSLGGTDTYLSSANPIPLDGRLRITHGEWDFISGTGIIGGLWTDTPSSGMSGLVYGLKYTGGNLYAVINGAVDTSTDIVPIDTTKRYVLRTLVEFNRSARFSQAYSYVDSTGVVNSLGNTGTADTGSFSTIVTEIDPTDGSITNQWHLDSTDTFGTDTSYANYVAVFSSGLHASFTGITVSVPLNASLEMANLVELNNLGFDVWDADDSPTGWHWHTNGFRETEFFDSGTAALKLQAGDDGTANVAQLCKGAIAPLTVYQITVRVAKTLATTSGTLSLGFTSAFAPSTAFHMHINAADIPSDGTYKTFTGTLTPTPAPEFFWDDPELLLLWTGEANVGAVYVDDVIVTTTWQRQIIGPNEVDAADGLAPVATIVGGNIGSDTKSTLTGASQFNAGQYQLVFFKDSVNRTSNIPVSNALIKLRYRSAGPAIGRTVSRSSIMSESQLWLDDGVRSVVRRDLTPRPRTSAECEMAAAAIVKENDFVHYEGSYKQYSQYFTEEPTSGSIFLFTNLTNMATVSAEEVHEVVTTLESSLHEIFLHTVTFGKPDHLRQFLGKFDSPQGAFQKTADSVPNPIDASAIGLSFADDVVAPTLLGWDMDNVFIDAGQDLTGSTFEVRYTDAGWGSDDGKNLVFRTTDRNMTIPRSLRGRVFFIRQVAANGNLNFYSEDLSQSNYTSTGTITMSNKLNPDGNISAIGSVSLATNGTVTATASGSGTVFSFSINGTAGKHVKVTFGATQQTYTLTGYWQRISITGTGSSVEIKALDTGTTDVDLTRFSLENGPTVETSYVKTGNAAYGAVSRYSAAVHVSFPLNVSEVIAQYPAANFLLAAPTTDADVSDQPVLRDSVAVEVTGTITEACSADVTFDIYKRGADDDPSLAATILAAPITIPASSTTRIKITTFASPSIVLTAGDILTGKLVDGPGDGTGMMLFVLKAVAINA